MRYTNLIGGLDLDDQLDFDRHAVGKRAALSSEVGGCFQQVLHTESRTHLDPDTRLPAACVRHDAMQCGFCTPGMVMSAIDLVHRHPKASEQTIREELEGNFCRCTGYQNIVKAVQHGAAAMGK